MSLGMSVVPRISFAGVLTCEDVFSHVAKKTPSARLGSSVVRAADVFLTLAGFGDYRFNQNLFISEVARYRLELSRPDSSDVHSTTLPVTPEAKLAFIEAAASVSGTTGVSLELWMQRAPSAALKPVHRALGRLDFEGGLQVARLEEAMSVIYLATHLDPLSLHAVLGPGLKGKYDGIKNFRKRSAPQAAQNIIRQRVERELTSGSLIQAATRLGLMASPSVRDRLVRKAREFPNVTETIAKIALNSIDYGLTWALTGHGFAFRLPSYSLMRTKPVPPELLELIQTKGFDAAYPALKAHYGHRPEFDLYWSVGRRIATVCLIAYLLSQLTDALPAMVPPGMIKESDSTGARFEKVYSFWKYVVEYRLGLATNQENPTLNDLNLFADEFTQYDPLGDETDAPHLEPQRGLKR
jgi:hypothetical protein